MEVGFTHTVVFHESFFCKRPEAFKAINMTSAFPKFFSVINGNMLPVKFQRVVGLEFVRIKDTPFFRMRSNLIHQGLCCDIIYYYCKDSALALQHAKYLNFPSRTAATRSCLLSTKIGLITFNFTRQFPVLFCEVVKNRQAIIHVMIPDLMVAPSQVFSGFAGWNLQTEVMQKLEIFFNYFQHNEASLTLGPINA